MNRLLKPFLLPALAFYAFHLQAQNPSDGCSGVPSLTVNATCVTTNYSLPGSYTNGGILNASCAAGQDRDDGWYQFTATGASTTIQATGDLALILAVFSACGGGTELGCAAVNGTTASVTVATVSGTTYYIQIHRRSGNHTDGMTGTICASSASGGGGGSNDEPCSATPLTVGSTCTFVSSTNATATATSGVTAPGCASYSGGDVWFTAVVPASGVLTVNSNTGTITDGGMALYSGTCSSLTLIECDDDDSPNGLMPMITRSGLTPGSTIWIRFWEYGNDNNGSFDICAYAPAVPTNDECSGAVSLTVNPNQACGTVTAGTINLSTASSNANSCGGTDDDDVWFSFVATGPTHTIDLLNVSGSVTDLYHAVFSGSCASTGTAILCSDPNSSTVGGLTAGNTYYVRVYTWTSTGGQNTTFDICIGTPPPPPANDNCVNATALPVNTSTTCTSIGSGYTSFASQSMAGCVGTASDDVWFSFTAQAAEHDVAISNVTGTTDLVHQVFSGSCGSLTSISCMDSPDNTSLTGLTVGATYYVRVYTYSSTGNNTGFDICVTSPCGVGGTPPSCSLNYSHSTISYNPASYTTGSLISFTDDKFAPSYTSIGFPFCYDGIIYNDILVSSNGYVTFPGCYSTHPSGTRSVAGGYSGYSINAAAPNTTNAPLNSILGVWQDIYPSAAATDGEIRTKLIGTAPNRKFVISYYNVRMFSCTTQDYNGQIILNETTNNIEIHIGEKTVCSTFNSGAGIMGLTDYTGTAAVIPSGYNYPTQWTVSTSSPQGHLFASNCGTCTVILPVELLRFEGFAETNRNRVTWTTATESNNAFFTLERSQGDAEFKEIALIRGAGNSNSPTDYTCYDENPETGTNYYRLRQTDFDGKVSYSEIISVQNQTSLMVTRIDPNPFSEKLSLKIHGAQAGKVEIRITNQLGRTVYTQKSDLSQGENNLQVKPGNLDAGIYFMIILDGNHNVLKTQKVVKIR